MNQSDGSNGPITGRALFLYGLMLAAAIGGFLLIRNFGEGLQAAAGEGTAPLSRGSGANQPHALLHLLLALATVIVVGRLLGCALAIIGQPPVIGEVVAGILLGPSLLGRLSPATMAFLLPPSVAPFLGVIAQLGVVLYMFLVGLELDIARLHAHARVTLAISHTGIVAPFLLGAALSLFVFPTLGPAGVPFTSFALFMGVSLSVTAFPVLARILADRGLTRTELGVIALGCAAAGDVTAWCLLAFVVGVAHARMGDGLLVCGLALGYIALMLVLIRPRAARFVARLEDRAINSSIIAGVLATLLLSALATEAIGIHAIFGAFLLGAIIPHDSTLARDLTHKLTDAVTVLLLPAFFAYTGLRTQIGLVTGLDAWLTCGLIILLATLGKFGGSLAAGRWTGLDWHTAASLGILMNTRGLMELIVLNIGLDLGVISPTLFAMLVLMALITTVATTPVLQILGRVIPMPACIPRGTPAQLIADAR